jgi:large subunit ribosomal protein L7e
MSESKKADSKKELRYKAYLQKRKGRQEGREKILAKKLKISVPVPEGLAKSWELQNIAREKGKASLAARRKALPGKRAEQAKRIRRYEAEYVKQSTDRRTKQLEARCAGNFYKAADPKVLVVVRIRGINRISPKVRKVLQLFRLLQIHNAVFIKVNKATINMLKIIQPYVAYGYPDLATIRALVYKRGFAKIRHRPGAISRIPIMSNDIVEKYLGRLKVDGEDSESAERVETVEDLVYQIYTAGAQFRQCTNFLWPFKLSCPRGGYRGRKRRHFNEGGSYGNWETHINRFIRTML